MSGIVVIPYGFHEAARNYRKLGEDAVYDLEIVLSKILGDMMFGIAKQFDAQGRRGGGSWRRISPRWAARKRKMGGDPRINMFRHQLRDSVTLVGAEHQHLEVNAFQGVIEIGSTLPYAETAQRNRPYIRFLPSDRKRWAGWVAKDLAEKWDERARRRTE